MPYVSQAQRGKFHILEKQGKISPSVVEEFDQASKGLKLPQHKLPSSGLKPAYIGSSLIPRTRASSSTLFQATQASQQRLRREGDGLSRAVCPALVRTRRVALLNSGSSSMITTLPTFMLLSP